MTITFDPLADIIDLRDVCQIVAYALGDDQNIDWEANEDEDAYDAYAFLRAVDQDLGLHNVQETDAEILRAVQNLADNEPTVIARSYFVEYAQELAEDCGMIDDNARWPATCIDWERAARDLEIDYFSFTYDGRVYLIRST